LSREEVTPAGPGNMTTMVRNPWTGTVLLCPPDGRECRQTYPAVQPLTVAKAAAIPSNRPGNGAAEDDAANTSPEYSIILPRQPPNNRLQHRE
jgi:hypothetical protein